MRRLLYLTLALVLLALIGSAFVRATNSGAYVARSLKTRIHEGMTRKDVHKLVGRDSDGGYPAEMAELFKAWKMDLWDLDGMYHLTVCYDPASHVVVDASLHKFGSPNALDKALEFIGYADVFYIGH